MPQSHTLNEQVRCRGCGLSFGVDVLGVPSGKDHSVLGAAKHGGSIEHVFNVVEFSAAAAVEIRRRMVAGRFEPNVAVRIVPHRTGAGCDVQFDFPFSEGPDWLGRSQNLSVLVDKRDAMLIQGATIDFQGGEFRVTRTHVPPGR